jgi:hypothetical protein
MQSQLHEILAVEKDRRKNDEKSTTAAHQAFQHGEFFTGFHKVYSPEEEDGLVFPPERKAVQLTVRELLADVVADKVRLLDTVASKDASNREAKADIILDDGEILVSDVPAVTLLTLETQLDVLATLVRRIPVVDPTEEWHRSESVDANLFVAEPTVTTKTAKIEEALVLYPATDKHPAQTKTITSDRVIGRWTTTKLSGAMLPREQAALIERVDNLRLCVKRARARANSHPLTQSKIGQAVLGYLFDEE